MTISTERPSRVNPVERSGPVEAEAGIDHKIFSFFEIGFLITIPIVIQFHKYASLSSNRQATKICPCRHGLS